MTTTATQPALRTLQNAFLALLVVDTIPGPVVMVGHSYGGAVISLGELGARFPGSTLGSVLVPVALPGGGKDLYVQQAKYREQIAADVPERVAALLAATQRPVAELAFSEKADSPAWKEVSSRFIYGTADKAIAPPLLAFMAQRAGSKHTVAVPGASHAVLASHADEVAALIEEAAAN